MMYTRREVLAAFLGAPFALAACRTTPENAEVQGEIVGANVDFGHILREYRNSEVPAANWENAKVVVVGGGAAGLSAAYHLSKSGERDLVLLELEASAGGTARSGKGDLIGYPWGAHYLPVPFAENAELAELLDEMRLTEGRGPAGEIIVKEQYLCREPEDRVFFKGRWYEGLYLHVGESNDEKAQFAAFQKQIDAWVNWRDADGRRAFVLPVAECSTDAAATELDKISFGDWLRQKELTSERLKWYCDYACRDDYGLKLDQTSAWAGLFYFCSRVRRSGDESQPFITFPEGNGRFIDHLFEKVRDRTRLGSVVIEMVPTGNSVDVVYLRDNELRGLHAEKAIYASPVFAARYVIRDFRESPPDHLGRFDHNAWFVANLFLKDRPKNRFTRDFPLAWDNVLYESPSLGYVNSTHQKGLDHGPAIFTYYYPMCAEDNGRAKLFGLNHRDLTDIILSDLSRAHPTIRELTERIDVMRWGHAMISPKPGLIWSGARELATKPFRNIHFAHSDLSGLALFEEAFHHGLRAAKEVMAASRVRR